MADHGPHSEKCATADGGDCFCDCKGAMHGIKLSGGKLRNMGDVNVTKARTAGGKEFARVVDGKTGRPPGGGTSKDKARAPEKPASGGTKPAGKPAGDKKTDRPARVGTSDVRLADEVEVLDRRGTALRKGRVTDIDMGRVTLDYTDGGKGAPSGEHIRSDLRVTRTAAEMDDEDRARMDREEAERREQTRQLRARRAAEAGGTKPAEKPKGGAGGPLADMSADDQQRIRNAVADRGPGIFASPMVGGSRSDVGRYLAEGELGRQLADRHDWRKVWQAVSQVIDEDPEALKRSPAKVKADTEARTAKADEIAGRANEAVKAGDLARAADLLDEAAAVDPDHVAYGRRLAEVRDLIRKKANEKPASKPADKPAEKPAGGAGKPAAGKTVAELKRNDYVSVTGQQAGGREGTATGYVATSTPAGNGRHLVVLTEYPGAHGKRHMVTVAGDAPAAAATPPADPKVNLWRNARTGRPVSNPTQPEIVRGELVRDPEREEKVRKALADLAGKPAGGGRPVELTTDGKETPYVPGARSTIGLPERPNVGRDKPPAQQLGLFADLAAEKRKQLAGQGTLLDAFNRVKPADPDDGLPPRLTAEESAAAIGTPVRDADGTMLGVVAARKDGKFDAIVGDAEAVASSRGAKVSLGHPTREAAEASLRQRAIAERLEAEERAKLPARRVLKSGSKWAVVNRDGHTLLEFKTKREAEEYAGPADGGTKPAEKPASKPAKAPGGYEVGQRVEVLTNNFDKPGFPEEWMPGRIAEIGQPGNRGVVDIGVRLEGKTDKNGEPLWHRELVGPRGGNKRLRVSADQGTPDRGKPVVDSRDRPDRDRNGAGPDGLVRGRPVEQLKRGDRVVGRTEGAAFRPLKAGEAPEVDSLTRGRDDIGAWTRVKFTDGSSERFYEGEHVTIRPGDGGVGRAVRKSSLGGALAKTAQRFNARKPPEKPTSGAGDAPARVEIPARFDDLPPFQRMRERLRHVEENTKTDVDKVTAEGRERARAEFNLPSDADLDRMHRNRTTNAEGFRALHMKSILSNAGEIEVERSRISRLEQQRAVMQDALDRGGLTPAVADNMRKMINPGGRLGNSLEEARIRLRNAESNQATAIQRLRENEARAADGGVKPTGEYAARIAEKEAELAKATEALTAEFNRRPHGSMRTKSFGQRVDAQIKRSAALSATVQKLTRELEGLRRDSEKPATVPKTITAETLKGARLIKDRYGWYEVEKVNRTTVKYKGPRGMDNLMKISKIVDYK